MPYYELKVIKRGYSPNALLPEIRPGSDRDGGSELIEAIDDDAAAAIGHQREAQLGPDYIISVYDVRNSERVMIYPRKRQDAQEP